MSSKAKKEKQFMAMYTPVHEKFERFCRARVYGRIDYKDLMHDAILIAYEKMDSIKSPDLFLSFLFGITIRVLANNNRKTDRLQYSSSFLTHEIEDSSDTVSRKDDANTLYAALAQISEEQREAIILFEISGFRIEEIAELQDASVSAVKKRLSRGRKALLEVLQMEKHRSQKLVV